MINRSFVFGAVVGGLVVMFVLPKVAQMRGKRSGD